MAAIVSQQISDESFSHGKLGNTKKPWDLLEESLSSSFNALDAASFIEVDLDFFSMRWTDSWEVNIKPSIPSEAFLTSHLFSQHLTNSLQSESGSSSATPSSISASQSKCWHSSVSADSSLSIRSPDSIPLRSRGNKRSTKSPSNILRKYLYFLVPLYWKVKSLKTASSKCRGNASQNLAWRRGSRDLDSEPASSIHDAVLHCKKSIAAA